MLIAALFILAQTAPASDAVTSFLERHGLNELLAIHLEDQLDALGQNAADAREELIMRLAGVYAALLERERDEEQRARLERRSRELLNRAPPNSADELRLALLRTSYLRAEEIAERHRLRQASDDEVALAKGALESIIPELQELNSHYDGALNQINARLARASGPDAAVLHESLDRLERMRGSCRFLLGWSLYYHQWLAGGGNTEAAERRFAEVLLSDVSRPQPEDVSVDLRAFEPMARAIVGMALCRSLSSSNSTTALRWIDLLEDEQTAASVREQARAWRLVIHLEHAEFRDARGLITEHLEKHGEVPVFWLRLAVISTIESDRRPAEAQSLRESAIAQLAAADELGQILDLAERYGSEGLGTRGFAVRYVNGLMRYREARQAEEDPNADGSPGRGLYREAEIELRAALNESDSANHPAAAAACRRLLAWALYFQGEYLRARREFEEASTELPDSDRPEALWMAIVCLDRLVQADDGRNEVLVEERRSLTNRFLEKFPASPRAATLLVDRAAQRGSLSAEEISRLLAIPPEHESYDAARRRVSHVLYLRFRGEQAGSDARIAAGEAFLGVAAPMLDSPSTFQGRESEGEEAAAQRTLVHIRRVLEVALHEGIENIHAARRALAAAYRLEREYPDVVSAHRQELTYRELQERMLAGDHPGAGDLAEALWQDPESIWARLGARAMFQQIHARWKRDGDAAADVLKTIVRHGGRVLREFEDDDDAIARSSVLSYHAAVAEASFMLWKMHGEAAEGPRALFLYQRMIRTHPRQRTFLRPAALLAAALDEHEFAAHCWRMLSSGAETGSDEWYEARIGLIEALAHVDPGRAREVLNQHRQLHPGYGPAPWDERFRAVARRLAQEDQA